MEDVKKIVNLVIYYDVAIFDSAICEYIKQKVEPDSISVSSDSQHQELLKKINKGEIDIILTEYNFIYKNCSTSQQLVFKNLCAKKNIKVLMFVQIINKAIIQQIINKKFDALICTRDDIGEFQKAIHHLTSKSTQQFISKSIKKMLCESPDAQSKKSLTSKEWEVFFLVTQGYSLSDIAAKKNRAISTIATQKQNVMKKLDIKNNAELLKYAYMNGML